MPAHRYDSRSWCCRGKKEGEEIIEEARRTRTIGTISDLLCVLQVKHLTRDWRTSSRLKVLSDPGVEPGPPEGEEDHLSHSSPARTSPSRCSWSMTSTCPPSCGPWPPPEEWEGFRRGDGTLAQALWDLRSHLVVESTQTRARAAP